MTGPELAHGPEPAAWPLVTVVIPTRDRHGAAPAAVRSALRQDYPALEVVVVDDGSDPPLSLPDELTADPRLRVLRLDEPQGPAVARNVAIRQAHGDLLAFLDDDDEWLPHKTRIQVEALLSASEQVAAVEGGYEKVDPDGVPVERFLPRSGDVHRALLAYPRLTPSTVLVRAAAVRAAGGFDPRLRRMQDWDLWIRLTETHRVVVIPMIVCRRRDNRLPASAILPWYEEMARRIRPRTVGLPEDLRRRLLAHHQFQIGVLYAQSGWPLRARRELWASWRLDWRFMRPLVNLPRTFTGEGPWRWGVRLVRRARAGWAHLTRRDRLLLSR